MIDKLQNLPYLCEKGMVFLFYILAFMLPMSSASCELIFVLLMLLFVIKRLAALLTKQKKYPMSIIPSAGFLGRPICVFIFFVIISVCSSQIFLRSVSGFFFEFLQNILYLCFAVEVFKSKNNFRIFLCILLFSLTLIAINGFWQIYTGKGFIVGREVTERYRMLSSLKHANDFGGYLVVILGIIQVLILLPLKSVKIFNIPFIALHRQNVANRIILFIMLFLALICLGFTFSRGAWIGFTFSSFALIFFLRNKRTFISLIIMMLFFIVFTPFMQKNRNVNFMTDQYKLIKQNKEVKANDGQMTEIKFGASGRNALWKVAVGQIKKYPLTGSGWNTYTELVEKMKFPHNSYLRLTAEIGIPGILSFFYFLSVLFWRVLCINGKIEDEFIRYLFLGFTVGILGFLVQSFVDTHLYSIQLATLMWVVIGMIIAIVEMQKETKTST